MLRRLIILLLIIGCSTEPEEIVIPISSVICENNYSELDGSLTSCGSGCLGAEGGCYLQNDIDVLADIIELDSLDIPYLQLGSQSWIQGRLISLDVSNVYPNLDTLPSTISNLTALTTLDLRYNNLTTLPNTICDIYDSLATIQLKSNSICPPYPECITDEDLDYQNQNECESIGCMDNTACNYDDTLFYSYLVDTCEYNSPNTGICDCAGVANGETVEDCAGICGGDAVVDEYGICCGDGAVVLWGTCYPASTTSINLPSGELTGEIPSEIGNLTNLYHLKLNDNQLTGEIPPEIGNLTNLTDLYLFGNQLTGEIPPEIGNLTNLTWLILSKNQITGEIPSEIGNLTSLTYLSLYDNQLTGEIPAEIGNLTNLTYLKLHDNQLSGDIPQEVCDLIESNSLPISYILDGNENFTNTCE